MKPIFILAVSLLVQLSCQKQNLVDQRIPLEGTWKLITSTVIEKGDTTVTDYSDGVSMIKIVNATHFSFLNHDLNKGIDSTSTFSAGGGRYSLAGDEYIEKLDYCSYREWEGNTFRFTVSIRDDSLIQQGVEKIEDLGVERLNIEKYVRVHSRDKDY